jgi:plastocyanin
VNASSFTTVTRSDGKQQLAFDGYPLYYYEKDVKPGYVLGQGIGHFFACCTATATAVTATTSTSSTAGGFAISIAKGASTNESSLGYSPSTVTLVVGVNNTVTWTNDDATIHTVTSFSVPAGARSFNSGTLAPGATFTFVFTVPGTYRYGCEIHPWMQGTVIVKG